ncbi:hypothetical protein BXZ70DRAFT_1010418 [Cristinia sonorae]|uniref:Transcriptional regulator n=1 Tax=Cristinia sonorae TaxID=1940300 RepID=A0A8K0UL50_9AGAR|nr:hypothetical protein BXZ70DRAFT_1010418 [Cristinia sonorae]
MTEVDLAAVKDAINTYVREAAAAGDLEQVTYGQARDAVEKELGLQPGTLKSAEYKPAVKEMIAGVTEEIEKEEEAAKATKGKKRKSTENENEKAPKAKVKVLPKKATKTVDKKGKGSKPKRSPSVVPSDNDEPTTSPKDLQEGSSKTPSSLREPPKKRQKQVASDDEGEKHRSTHEAEVSSSASTLETPAKSEPASKPGAKSDDAGEKSESEMSVLIDEPPPKRGRKKSDDKNKDCQPAKGRKKKVPAEELSKDDQQIKRLKSLVVACGVRKVWAKEFKDMESKSAQIRRLKEILSGLGMNGRLSLEQAKAIKEKREFEQELEDVKEFEKAVVSGPRPNRGGRLANKKTSNDDISEDEMSDIPKKPKNAARHSIMAFLGDQSDSD